ncbi:hypothetical protein D3C71_2087600 [compost metagenome]
MAASVDDNDLITLRFPPVGRIFDVGNCRTDHLWTGSAFDAQFFEPVEAAYLLPCAIGVDNQ